MTATSATAIQSKQRPWWLTLITGVSLVVIGGMLLWSPGKAKVDTY